MRGWSNESTGLRLDFVGCCDFNGLLSPGTEFASRVEGLGRQTTYNHRPIFFCDVDIEDREFGEAAHPKSHYSFDFSAIMPRKAPLASPSTTAA